MMDRSAYKYIFFVGITLVLSSCTSSNSDSELVSTTDTSVSSTEESNLKAQNVFNSIPSPIETTQLLKSAGADYNSAYLNPIENVSKYVTTSSKALNLGVYGSDLSFTSVFNQTQESMLYLSCTNKLARGLGINGSFDENTSSRLEENQANRDSLLTIISDSYWNADEYLRKNGQAGTSAIFIAGAWLEGLYVAACIANETKNEKVSNLIAEQKHSFENLYSLLESQSAQNKDVKNVLEQLGELKKIFDGIQKNDPFRLTQTQLLQITQESAAIRKRIIQ